MSTVPDVCEVVDARGRSTGRLVSRGATLGAGEFYHVVHVWIRDEIGHYLVQQRASHLDSYPGAWSTTAGYVLPGETGATAAIREVREELALSLSVAELRAIRRAASKDRFEEIWLASVNRREVGDPRGATEVADWMWANLDELSAMLARGEFVHYNYFDQLPTWM